MDLCTVISEGFIDQAINLIYSYKYNSYNKNVYIYYFNIENNTNLSHKEVSKKKELDKEKKDKAASSLKDIVSKSQMNRKKNNFQEQFY